jgi:hypothetical protein
MQRVSHAWRFETKDQRIARGRRNAARVLDFAVNKFGWVKTCRRGDRVYLRSPNGARGYVDLNCGEISARLWFVMHEALRDA